jgi:hypothetical protein
LRGNFARRVSRPNGDHSGGRLSPKTGWEKTLSKDPDRSDKLERVLAYFREDPSRARQRIAQTLKDCHVSLGLIAKARRIFDPDIPVRGYTTKKKRAYRRRLPGPSKTPPPVEPLLAEPNVPEVKAIADDPTMTTDEKRMFLRKLAENSEARDEAKISAIRTLHLIDESVGKSRELGPGAPLTFEDKVHRLSLLITAVGPDVARESVRIAKKEWGLSGALKTAEADEPGPSS